MSQYVERELPKRITEQLRGMDVSVSFNGEKLGNAIVENIFSGKGGISLEIL